MKGCLCRYEEDFSTKCQFYKGSNLFFCCKVHVRTWKCGTVTCNCGVAVQEGNEVIVIDMCDDRIPRVRFASTAEPRSTVKRDANGRIFLVCN